MFVSLDLEYRESGKTLVAGKYTEGGRPQTGKLIFLGGLAKKDAFRQSTKSAMDKIITRFLADVAAALPPAGDRAAM
jgi:hypothetical protein